MGSAGSKPDESKPAEDGHTKSIKPYGHPDNATSIKLNSSHRAHYDGVVSLIEKNKYSDLLVICGSDRYPVHRAIVCPRSTWFEDKYEEPDVIAAVLTFLYTLDYADSGPQLSFGLPHDRSSLFSHDSGAEGHAPPPPEDGCQGSISSPTPAESENESRPATSREGSPLPTPAASSSSPDNTSTHTVHADPGSQPNELVLHAKMCLAGHRFGIPPLLEVAKEKFEKRLRSETWKAEMLPCIHEIERQQGSCDTIRELKDSLLKSAKRRFRDLKQMDGLKEMVMDCPEFASELMKNL
ncbi:uncharacterized protein K441DRAFT_560365 [Cenococcum geophilum 1.58]|uniref:uncharacterized protein n=1 Tax=Cenococcum geophilum 1.58 TaxID=794803 RepID=UPI00358DE65E|nr:hypothetical protein K441DRAFT_560365 [Cenococcum geophilum 1.58]